MILNYRSLRILEKRPYTDQEIAAFAAASERQALYGLELLVMAHDAKDTSALRDTALRLENLFAIDPSPATRHMIAILPCSHLTPVLKLPPDTNYFTGLYPLPGLTLEPDLLSNLCAVR